MPVHTKLRADDRLHMSRPAESWRVHDALDLAIGRGNRLNLDSSHLVAPSVLDRTKPRRTHTRGLGRPNRRHLPMLCLRLAPDSTLRHSSAPSRSIPAGRWMCGNSSSLFGPPASGSARRLREERAHQRPQRSATTLWACDLGLVVLADREGHRHVASALVTVVLVCKHGCSSFSLQAPCPSHRKV